mmetsp:Transcript_8688/g.29835  ORF Transcript_8688/g.29835 Transcript_8688/m.29835 type:complete len:275 (+) Transcript_8688:777-1601(+)
MAPVIHHFFPLTKTRSPSQDTVDATLVASLLATSGSVIAKHDRMSPSSSGRSHLLHCSGVPCLARTSMLPVSGAEQLKTSGAWGYLPIISASSAYCLLDSIGPSSRDHCCLSILTPASSRADLASSQRSGVKNAFHRPVRLARLLSLSMEGWGDHLWSVDARFTSLGSILPTLAQNTLHLCFRTSNFEEPSRQSETSIKSIAVSMTPLTTPTLPTKPAFAAEAFPALALDPTPARMAATLKSASCTNHRQRGLRTNSSAPSATIEDSQSFRWDR